MTDFAGMVVAPETAKGTAHSWPNRSQYGVNAGRQLQSGEFSLPFTGGSKDEWTARRTVLGRHGQTVRFPIGTLRMPSPIVLDADILGP